jgi:hypothetical protein
MKGTLNLALENTKACIEDIEKAIDKSDEQYANLLFYQRYGVRNLKAKLRSNK